jgi:ATP-dependent Clp protease ATP-binding subunit ClpB
MLAEMRTHFRPEFLNRLDDILLFKPLTQPEIERIVDHMLDDVRARLAERQIKLEIAEDARRFVAQQGFDPIYGAAAAPVHRQEVETRIGRALLAGDVLDGAVIRIGYMDGGLTVTYENPALPGTGPSHVRRGDQMPELRAAEPGTRRGRRDPALRELPPSAALDRRRR